MTQRSYFVTLTIPDDIGNLPSPSELQEYLAEGLALEAVVTEANPGYEENLP